MLLLALETSCDETAAAVLRTPDTVLASEISSRSSFTVRSGGVVPEVASRNHIVMARPVIEAALDRAAVSLREIDAFAATAGPGLASSLLVGNTIAKSLAACTGKPFIAVNHLEGHLLSPFLNSASAPGTAVRPCVALVVSGGHTMLVRLRAVGDYLLMGRTRDDAAGEAFDKVGKMLGLPYPGGPEIDRLARDGDPGVFHFPRSMLNRPGFEFSFSGLKTSMLHTLRKIPNPADHLADLCAGFQQAVTDVLVEKTMRAAREVGESLITVSGGVSANSHLRKAFENRCARENLELIIASGSLSTDNAAMIAYVAAHRLAAGLTSELDEDIDPNLPLVSVSE